jgi:hypothetical protein
MKLFEKLWQRLHYNVFVFNKFTQIYVFGLPVFFLLKNKFVKRFYLRKGIKNPESIIRKSLIDPQNSTIISLSDGFMGILFILMLFTSLNFISALFHIILLTKLSKIFLVSICVIPSMGLNYYLLWKDNKYLILFKQFDKEPIGLKRKWAWISFGIIVSIILMLVLSFWVMIEAVHQH